MYYKVEFAGAIYVEAKSAEEAIAKIDEDEDHFDVVFKEWKHGDKATEVSDEEVDCKIHFRDWR